uniref:beta-ketoacyl-[acyl-carrier-protein] synthase family protein n=1 Tax=Thaumasiovibrio occultus TaxID=1891184 RepID=UPI000B35CDF4|nr:beta-ketoacyl-[acyl-carrier-protein] synthase family protein [Thaumasiovibrio occultus]
MKRVVVTGLGAVSGFGAGQQTLWQNLLAGNSAIAPITHLPVYGDIVAIASSMPEMEDDIAQVEGLAQIQTEDPSIRKFMVAVDEAMKQAGVAPHSETANEMASMIADRPYSPMYHIDRYIDDIHAGWVGDSLKNDDFFSALQRNPAHDCRVDLDSWDSANHFAARFYGLQGPSLSIGTACASGNNAIGEAFEKIRRGRLNIALAGGAYDFDLNTMIGFTRIGALTTNPDPQTACRPFDAERSGFVMGSGCGVLVLESLESALARNATILCEVTGYASFTDGYRATDPDPEAVAACRTLQTALDCAGLKPADIDYINAHGTSTKMNDRSETTAIKKVFGEAAYDVAVSSTKSMIGHGIMAAGPLEAVACINAIREGVIHGTRNYTTQDPELDLDYVPEVSRKMEVNHVLSNNFGFGGQNATVIFSKFKEEI